MSPPPHFQPTNRRVNQPTNRFLEGKKAVSTAFFMPTVQQKVPQEEVDTQNDVITSTHLPGYVGAIQNKRLDTSSAMVPTFEQKHQVNHQEVLQQKIIQMDKIDHRALTWGDFKGKAGKGYDAETYSDIRDLTIEDYPFTTLQAVDTGTTFEKKGKKTDCEKGKDKDKEASKHPEKYRAFRVDITPKNIDTKIEIKAFMDQDKSWKQDWTTDIAARKKKALAKEAVSCKSFFSSEEKKAKKQATEMENECEKALTKEGDTWKIGDAQATKKEECSTIIRPSVLAEYMLAVKYSAEKGSSAKKLNECDTKFVDLLAKTEYEERSKALLQHEQRHFDITHQMALKAQKVIDKLIPTFTTEIQGCGKESTLKKAIDESKKQKKQIIAKFSEVKKQVQSYQNSYDSQTNHGTISDMQTKWADNIDEGLPEKTLKK
jgi:hypothetical protein